MYNNPKFVDIKSFYVIVIVVYIFVSEDVSRNQKFW